MVISKLLLVRHGESTGNRDHIWAGITDNELTSHGFLQAQRLGAYLAKLRIDREVYTIYCSDLIRARRTAREIAREIDTELTTTKLLREQDLGWREGLTIKAGDRSDIKNAHAISANPGETKEDMDVRAKSFIEHHLHKSIGDMDQHLTHGNQSPACSSVDKVIIIVSHGLFLLRLYYNLVKHLSISCPPSPSWSNTGCTQITIRPGISATVTDVNSLEHLKGLKRTRAGVGSSQYDPKQQKVSKFFGGKKLRESRTANTDEKQPSSESVDEIMRGLEMPDASDRDTSEIQAQIAAIDAACEISKNQAQAST